MNDLLDRPVWQALTGRQAHLAVAHGAAVRIDPGYGVFAALREPSAECWNALAATLTDGDDAVGLVEAERLRPSTAFRTLREAELVQMVWDGGEVLPELDPRIALLSASDAPAMAELAYATEPGPWSTRTHLFGAFYGIRVEGRLAAMAGERLLLPRLAEVSGVCTWPEFRGQGLAAALVRKVMHGFQQRGDRPFLHCYGDNIGAVRLYEKMGFRLRRHMSLLVLALA
jgi:ribosomal protein S18 acetylase RimI-like enzyme